jgi:arsenate reductase
MAEGFLRSRNPELEVYSAGTEPADEVHPRAIEVMDELGIDISREDPKSVDNFVDESFDYVITVCDDAKENCPVFTGNVKEYLHFSFEDPTQAEGTEEEVLNAFRKVRDEIRDRFGEFFTNISDSFQYDIKW